MAFNVERDPTEPGEPILLALEPEAETQESKGGWTPEVMAVLLKGVYGMLASWRGPHWGWNEEEGNPLIEPTAEVFNMTPYLKDLAPSHIAILTVVLGHGTMIAKRLAWDAEIAKMKKQQAAQQKQQEQEPSRRAAGSQDGIYGPNQFEEEKS